MLSSSVNIPFLLSTFAMRTSRYDLLVYIYIFLLRYYSSAANSDSIDCIQLQKDRKEKKKCLENAGDVCYYSCLPSKQGYKERFSTKHNPQLTHVANRAAAKGAKKLPKDELSSSASRSRRLPRRQLLT